MSENTIHDLSSNHKYRTEIPNIIFELGLKPNELSVYLILKRTAGDGGKCTKSTRRLCKESHISRNNLVKIRKKLSEIFPLIKKPLIECCNRTSECGDKDTVLINIVDIWPENYDYFKNCLGGSNEIPRGAKQIPRGVAQTEYQGGSNEVHKEQQVKKNNKNNNKPKALAAAFYSCLKEQDFPDEEKVWITNKATEERVKLALEYVNAPGEKIRTSILQTVKWHIQQASPPQPKGSELTEQQTAALKFNEVLRKHGYYKLADKNEKLIPKNKMFIIEGGAEMSISLLNSTKTIKEDFKLCMKCLVDLKTNVIK